MKRYVTTLLESTEQVPTVRIGISYCSQIRMTLPDSCRTLSMKIEFFQRQREQLIAPFFWIRSGNMVVILLIRQTATLADIFQIMLLALLCSRRFLENLLLKKPSTLSDLVVRIQRVKSVNSLLNGIMSGSQKLSTLMLPQVLCNLAPFGGRITLFSSLNLLELTHSLMKKNIEYLRFTQN